VPAAIGSRELVSALNRHRRRKPKWAPGPGTQYRTPAFSTGKSSVSH